MPDPRLAPRRHLTGDRMALPLATAWCHSGAYSTLLDATPEGDRARMRAGPMRATALIMAAGEGHVTGVYPVGTKAFIRDRANGLGLRRALRHGQAARSRPFARARFPVASSAVTMGLQRPSRRRQAIYG